MEPVIMDKRQAFSLVELLVVMAVIGLLAVVVVPSAGSIMRGSQLTSAGQTFYDQCVLARQTAISRNHTVEVRFYQDGSAACGLASYLVQDDATRLPLSRLQWLPTSIRLASSLTTLSTNIFSSTGNTNLPGRGPASYFAFSFRADGSLSSSMFSTNQPLLTLINQGAAESSPPNFFTLQFDPVTGRAAVYRP